jgi:hypothetical protein
LSIRETKRPGIVPGPFKGLNRFLACLQALHGTGTQNLPGVIDAGRLFGYHVPLVIHDLKITRCGNPVNPFVFTVCRAWSPLRVIQYT